MPMDGFTLSYMMKELSPVLLGGRVDKVNQPEKDVLILFIRSAGENRRLLLNAGASQPRIQFTRQTYENPAEPPMFCMLMRKHLLSSRIVSVEQIRGDRIVCLTFECLNEMGDHVEKKLYLEIMGKHSNLTLVNEDGTIVDAIHHVNSEMSRVRTVLPGGQYVLPPKQEKLSPENLDTALLEERLRNFSGTFQKFLMENISGMAGICSQEVCAQLGIPATIPATETDATRTAAMLCNFYAEKQPAPVVLFDEAGLAIDFFPFTYLTYSHENQRPADTLSEAMDRFFLGRELHFRMQQKSASLQKHIKTALERTEKKKALMLETLAKADQTEQDRIFGELLTANLHGIRSGAETAQVQNYYDPECPMISIPLSVRLSPAQNAQAYYKKYRKAKTAEQYAREQLQGIEKDLLLLETAMDDLDKCQNSVDIAEVRYVLAENGFLRPDSDMRKQKSKKLQEGKPYRFTAPDGTVIEVGKNSLQNDRLTLHARGNETWLHAQGIPGSHVVIRTENEPADETLLYAAKLATYFSKGKNQPLQPIDYTLRKYVKKGSNAPAGLVTYTHFKTLIIGLTPEDFAFILKESAKNK